MGNVTNILLIPSLPGFQEVTLFSVHWSLQKDNKLFLSANIWGVVNLSKVLLWYDFKGYGFWPPSGLKNRTQKTVPLKNPTSKNA